MKSLRALSLMMVVAMVLSLSIIAAPITVPSVQKSDIEFSSTETDKFGAPVVAYIYDENQNVVGTISTADMIVAPAAAEAVASLKNTDVETLIPDFANVWSEVSEGAPVENATVAAVFDISLGASLAAGTSVTFTVKNPGIASDVAVMVIHNYEGDKWEVVPSERTADGDIKITTNSFSPFAIIVDNNAAPSTDVTSPKTGVSNNGLAVAGCVAVLACAAVVCFGKAKNER